MATVPKILTYEEWLRLPPVEDGTDEVVNGELRVMPPTHYPHAEILEALIALLLPQIDRRKIRVLGSNFGLMIRREPLTCRSPDLAMYWRDRDRIEDGLHYAPPDLVVEILSPSENRRRKNEKLQDYASIGVPEVWLCSPEAESVEVLHLSEGKLERVAILLDGELRPTRFPGVSVRVAELWPD